jgi:hypothetical protein
MFVSIIYYPLSSAQSKRGEASESFGDCVSECVRVCARLVLAEFPTISRIEVSFPYEEDFLLVAAMSFSPMQNSTAKIKFPIVPVELRKQKKTQFFLNFLLTLLYFTS